MGKILEMIALSRQDFRCRACQRPLVLRSYFAFPIPPDDPHWTRVYKAGHAEGYRATPQRLKAYCSPHCAPAWGQPSCRTQHARFARGSPLLAGGATGGAPAAGPGAGGALGDAAAGLARQPDAPVAAAAEKTYTTGAAPNARHPSSQPRHVNPQPNVEQTCADVLGAGRRQLFELLPDINFTETAAAVRGIAESGGGLECTFICLLALLVCANLVDLVARSTPRRVCDAYFTAGGGFEPRLTAHLTGRMGYNGVSGAVLQGAEPSYIIAVKEMLLLKRIISPTGA